MKNRSLKSKIIKKINAANIMTVLVSVAVSFVIVHVQGHISYSSNRMSKSDSLISSAGRIADAFEIYNQKRFSQ